MDDVPATLQAAVVAGLRARYGCEDEAMAEYVCLMLQNGKAASEITAELGELVPGYEQAFSEWAIAQLQRVRQGMEVEPVPTATTTTTTNAQTQSTQTQSSQIERHPVREDIARHRPDQDGARGSPYGVVRRGGDGVPSGPRAAGGPVRKSDSLLSRLSGAPRSVSPTRSREAPLRTQRCRRWPECTRGERCTFAHPTSLCTGAPCPHWKPGFCPSIHADEGIDLAAAVAKQRAVDAQQTRDRDQDDVEMHVDPPRRAYVSQRKPPPTGGDLATMPLCRFAEGCTNKPCVFGHPSPASVAGSSVVLDPSACTSGKDCADKDCAKAHPSPALNYAPKADTMATVQCRFRPCLNSYCRFAHDPGQKAAAAFGPPRNMVWTPGMTTADRVFVTDEPTEQLSDAQ